MMPVLDRPSEQPAQHDHLQPSRATDWPGQAPVNGRQRERPQPQQQQQERRRRRSSRAHGGSIKEVALLMYGRQHLPECTVILGWACSSRPAQARDCGTGCAACRPHAPYNSSVERRKKQRPHMHIGLFAGLPCT